MSDFIPKAGGVKIGGLGRKAQKLQAAPLGLSGDTVKKQKKVKDKNAPKERLQDKEVTPAPKPVA